MSDLNGKPIHLDECKKIGKALDNQILCELDRFCSAYAWLDLRQHLNRKITVERDVTTDIVKKYLSVALMRSPDISIPCLGSYWLFLQLGFKKYFYISKYSDKQYAHHSNLSSS